MIIQRTIEGDDDYNQGIRGYTDRVMACKGCGCLCNMYWASYKHENGYPMIVFACSQDCADSVARRYDGDYE